MSEPLVVGSIVLFGCLIAVSAAILRVAERRTYWTASVAWIAAIAVAFALAGRGSQSRDVFAAVTLVGAFPVLVTFLVARRTTSGLWLATALAVASWLTALFVGVTFGLSSGLIRK